MRIANTKSTDIARLIVFIDKPPVRKNGIRTMYGCQWKHAELLSPSESTSLCINDNHLFVTNLYLGKYYHKIHIMSILESKNFRVCLAKLIAAALRQSEVTCFCRSIPP